MSEFYAHSGDPAKISTWEPLLVHLVRVARQAEQFAAAARPGDSILAQAAYAAGMLHDLGKYQSEWQLYLHDSVAKRATSRVPHSIHGAAHAAYSLGNQALCMAIFGHHAGLPDFDTQIHNDLLSRHPDLAPLVEGLVAVAKSECSTFPEAVTDHPLDPGDKRPPAVRILDPDALLNPRRCRPADD